MIDAQKKASKDIEESQVIIEKEDKQAVVDAMASGSSTKLNQAQAENTELADASTGSTLVNAPTTTINNTQGGGGSSNVIPIPISEPDPKTKAMIANNF